MLVTRRAFAGVLGTAAVGVLAGGIPRSARSEGGSMLKRPIPKTGETIPAIGLGTWSTFDVTLDAATRERLGAVLARFHAAGGRVVDSSPMYGRAEEVVGTLGAENGLGASLFVATKVWTKGRDEGIRQMQTSMRRLRRERLDLIQVHNLLDAATHLDTLAKWKAQGRVRYTGITHYVPSAFDDLERFMRSHKPDFVQLCYSAGRREAESKLLPLAAELGIAVLVNRPFEEGALFRAVKGKPLPDWAAEAGCASWAQLFLKFILAHPAVTCAIPATGNPEHLADNVKAGIGEPLTPDHRERLIRIVEG